MDKKRRTMLTASQPSIILPVFLVKSKAAYFFKAYYARLAPGMMRLFLFCSKNLKKGRRKTMKAKKRFLSLLLVICLVAGLCRQLYLRRTAARRYSSAQMP